MNSGIELRNWKNVLPKASSLVATTSSVPHQKTLLYSSDIYIFYIERSLDKNNKQVFTNCILHVLEKQSVIFIANRRWSVQNAGCYIL